MNRDTIADFAADTAIIVGAFCIRNVVVLAGLSTIALAALAN